MNQEDYVSYELSKALKAAGFDEPCDKWIASKSFSYYDEDECCDHNAVIRKGWLISQKQKEKYDQEALPYLSLWHAQKWLREKWGIHVDACVFSDHSTDADGNVCDRWDFWGFDLYAVVGGEKMIDDDGEYDSYEQALSAGIAAALELIKKGE